MRRVFPGGIALAMMLAPITSADAACTRLALSDVAFGKVAATVVARRKLLSYAEDIARRRAWRPGAPLTMSREHVSCTIYLDLGPIGTEYRCLVTATFCQK